MSRSPYDCGGPNRLFSERQKPIGQTKFVVTTAPKPDGTIIQTLNQEVDGITHQLQRWIVNTMDEGIRNALIDMGWTPPDHK